MVADLTPPAAYRAEAHQLHSSYWMGRWGYTSNKRLARYNMLGKPLSLGAGSTAFAIDIDGAPFRYILLPRRVHPARKVEAAAIRLPR